MIRAAWAVHQYASQKEDADMTRDQLIREIRNNGASWPALLVVYGMLVGTLVLTAQAII